MHPLLGVILILLSWVAGFTQLLAAVGLLRAATHPHHSEAPYFQAESIALIGLATACLVGGWFARRLVARGSATWRPVAAVIWGLPWGTLTRYLAYWACSKFDDASKSTATFIDDALRGHALENDHR